MHCPLAHRKYDLNAAVYCSALTEERKEEKNIQILVWPVVLSVVQEQTSRKEMIVALYENYICICVCYAIFG